jgi:uncharacterized membrane protein YbhN (UPF0104 family)
MLDFIKRNLNLTSILIIKILIFIFSVYLINIKLNAPTYDIAFYLNRINYLNFFIILIISMSFMLCQMYVHYYVTSINIKKKINFIYFSKLFFNSQVLNIIIPHIGLLYRAYFLKKIKIKYLTFININLYFFWFSIFFYFFLYSIEILLFGNNLKFSNLYLFVLFLSIAILIYLLPKILSSLHKNQYKILSKINFIYQKKIMSFFRNCFKKTFTFMVIFNSILHILNFLLMLLLIKNIEVNNIAFNSVVIFFIFNSIIDQFPITPKNFGVGELLMGYSATSIGLSFEFGVALKLLIRFFYYLNLSIVVFYFNLQEFNTK